MTVAPVENRRVNTQRPIRDSPGPWRSDRSSIFINPALVAAIFVLSYGAIGLVTYGRWFSHLEVAERATEFSSVPYSSVFRVHVLASFLLALPALIRPKLHMQRVARKGQISERVDPTWAVLLAGIPLFLLITGGGALLFSRAQYIEPWQTPGLFRLGSVGFTPACLILLAVLLQARGHSRGPALKLALVLLLGYLTVGLAMATREIAVPAASLSLLMIRRFSSRKLPAVAGVLLAAQTSISVALGLRPASAHGLRFYIPELGNWDTWSMSFLDPIANLLNGFHGSGAAMRLDAGANTGPGLAELVNPLHSPTVSELQALDFGVRYPMPSLGFLSSQGTTEFVSMLLAIGVALSLFGLVAEAIAQRKYVPPVLRMVGLPSAYAAAALASIFLVQYKLYSTAVPLRFAIVACVAGIGLIKLSDFALRRNLVR